MGSIYSLSQFRALKETKETLTRGSREAVSVDMLWKLANIKERLDRISLLINKLKRGKHVYEEEMDELREDHTDSTKLR